MSIFRGIIAEQFVAQELHALHDPFIEGALYYWENLNPTSDAEIDFLVNMGQQLLPIEVKSGATGRLKSLRQFMESKAAALGIRISELPMICDRNVLSIPFYLTSEIQRLAQLANHL